MTCGATSEVAKLIGIAPVTARKYSQLLEEKGLLLSKISLLIHSSGGVKEE